MFCNNCGNKIDINSKFCSNCGATINKKFNNESSSDKANYVFKFNEAVILHKHQSALFSVVRCLLLVIIAVFIISLLLFGVEFLEGINLGVCIVALSSSVTVFFTLNKKNIVPSPIELHFYNDYLMIYQPRRCYAKESDARMEYTKMNYSTITKCVLYARTKRVQIYGEMHHVWYDYDANNNISSKPSGDKKAKNALVYFSLRCANGINIKEVIESNSPIVVTIENL